MKYFATRERKVLSHAEMPCYEDNDDHAIPEMEDCTRDYIEKKLGCRLPWNKAGVERKTCSSKSDLQVGLAHVCKWVGQVKRL